MSQGPCLNPNCKSHGAPHPNCKCYGGMSDGGEVEYYCAKGMPHEPNCEYFAEGGDINTPPPGYEDLDTPPKGYSEDIPQIHGEIPGNLDTPPKGYEDIDTPPPGYTSEEDDYTSIGQKGLAALEGVARGTTFGLSDVAIKGAQPLREMAKNLGLDPNLLVPSMEDVEKRKKYNSGISEGANTAAQVASLFTGKGAIGAIGKVAESIPILSKLGATALKGFIEGTAMQGSDEISKYLLTGEGDAEPSVASSIAHIGASGLLGAGTGLAFKGSSAALKALDDSKIAQRATSWLMGASGNIPEAMLKSGQGSLKSIDLDLAALKLGTKFSEENIKNLGSIVAQKAARATGGTIGGKAAGFLGYEWGGKAGEKFLGPVLEKIIGKPLNSLGKNYGEAAALKALSAGDATGLWSLMQHAGEMKRGAQQINKGVEALFKGGSKGVYDFLDPNEKDREKLRSYVEDGVQNDQLQQEVTGTPDNTPKFAEGGSVQLPPTQDPIATHYPAQAMALNAAKGRINNYLNANRPQPNNKLPFDTEIKDVQKENSYNKLLDMANKPLSILKHINKGTLNSENLKHFVNMYPELHNQLSKKITEHIVNKQMDEEKPNYKMRQSLSLFLGSPLDSTMSPNGIQAIQATFAPKGVQPPQQKPKKASNKSSLDKVAKEYKTQDQAAASRQQNDH